MKLSTQVYMKILFGERIERYKLYDEFWYVVKWNEQTNIHYTIKGADHKRTFLWYLAATSYKPKFRCETQSITVISPLEGS